ncbi:MAG TPA: hypothetical protein VFV01_20005 [Spirillospora sp.]|nr:hypothetical protein [Spirillospora sp.]
MENLSVLFTYISEVRRAARRSVDDTANSMTMPMAEFCSNHRAARQEECAR